MEDNSKASYLYTAGLNLEDYPSLAEKLVKEGKIELACEVMRQYEINQNNPLLKYISLGNFYNIQLKNFKAAIPYYEKFIEIDNSKPVVYTILANLYLKAYGENSREKQLYYWKKANNLRPNDRLILHGLAFCNEKLGKAQEAQKYYEQLILNNPTAVDYYNYGCFLIHHGDFIRGHKYFAYRNLIDNPVFKNTLTPDINSIERLKGNISDKVILVHYEQGFGDTIMYSRFVPFLTSKAQKVIFIVQNSLVDLLKNSKIFDGVEIMSDKENWHQQKYDFPLMLLDAPYILGVSTNEIPFRGGYLNTEPSLIKKYAGKYLAKDKSFKIGISYSGDKNANYNGRDVDIDKFKPLMDINGVSVYSLQKDSEKSIPGIIELGNTFDNFTDTACAIKNMDLVISTDNVILNLAGALGVKTIGLFNKQTNYRWYRQSSECNKENTSDTGWYSSIYPLKTSKQDNWESVFRDLMNIIKTSL